MSERERERDRETQRTTSPLQMGEYFGWAVATADLNGDGYVTPLNTIVL